MKFAARFLILPAAGLIFSAAVRAQDLAAPANPYTALVTRNIFGLVPIPPAEPPPPPPVDPPPKITPNGIMSIFGKYQVLFKTPGKVKAGQPPKEESYVMGEGDRQDDIAVMKIDDKAGMVTFDNHGVIQELPLVVAQNVGAPAAPGAPGSVPVPPSATPGTGGFGGGRFGRAARPNKNVTSSADVAPSPGAENPTAPVNSNPQIYQPANIENIRPEDQVILIEAQRLKYQQENNPIANLLPPTPAQKLLQDPNQ